MGARLAGEGVVRFRAREARAARTPSPQLRKSALVVFVLPGIGNTAAVHHPAFRARPDHEQPAAVVDTAIARMGGLDALRGVRTVRYEMMTQWLRLSFDPRPFNNAPVYERHTDTRDYSTRTWRNVRRLGVVSQEREFIDLVVDTIAARFSATPLPSVANSGPATDGWTPLNVAYVDERKELFAFTPDRLVLLLREAPDLAERADTLIGGIGHSAVTGTILGYPATVFFRRTDGLPTFARYHADESNDLGLAPWGPMDVEVWYSRWQRDAKSFVVTARQWDVVRVGRPYKRMTVLSAEFNPDVNADSLSLTSAVRTAFLATGRHPMADLPLDSARFALDGGIALFNSPAGPATAIKMGRSWLLVEPGNLPLNAERAARWLQSRDGGHTIGGVLTTDLPSGGAAWLAKEGMPVYAAPAIALGGAASLRNFGVPTNTLHVVTRGEWLRIGGDSVWAEPIDFPNVAGALLIYAPSIRWAYSSAITSAVEVAIAKARLQRRGWAVDRTGGPRSPAGIAPS
jgi:hypothetical protein